MPNFTGVGAVFDGPTAPDFNLRSAIQILADIDKLIC